MNDDELKELVFLERDIKEYKQRLEDLEARKKELSVGLLNHFETVSEEPIETDEIKISYVKPSVRYSIDKAKLEEKYPAIAEEFTKETKVKASVRISLKKGE